MMPNESPAIIKAADIIERYRVRTYLRGNCYIRGISETNVE